MKWEYKVTGNDALYQQSGERLERELTALGAEGWELVAIRPARSMSVDYYVFKRRIVDPHVQVLPVTDVYTGTTPMSTRWDGGW